MKTASFFVLAVILVGCGASSGSEQTRVRQVDNPYDGLWQNSLEVPFRLVLEQSFGAEEKPDEEILASISGLAVDAEGNVYITDKKQHRLVSFDKYGSFRWTVGRKGQGPGEFEGPYGVKWNGDDRLFIVNRNDTRLEIFDLDGNYIESKTFDRLDLGQASLVGFLDPRTMVLSVRKRGHIGADVHIVSIDEPWSTNSTIKIRQSDDLDFPARLSMPPTIAIAEGEVVVGYFEKYQLEFYDPSGKLTRIVTRRVDEFIRPGIIMGRVYNIAALSRVDFPIEISNGYRLVSAQWPDDVRDPDKYMEEMMASRMSNVYKTVLDFSLDLYDEDWQLVYSSVEKRAQKDFWDDPPHGVRRFFTSDKNGNVYALITDDYPKVGRYRVEIDEPVTE